MKTTRLTEIDLDANIEAWHLPHMGNYANDTWRGCTGSCDQGRSACNCAIGMPRSHPVDLPQMFDVETERPVLTSALVAIVLVATLAISVLLVGCGGTEDEPAATPCEQQASCVYDNPPRDRIPTPPAGNTGAAQ